MYTPDDLWDPVRGRYKGVTSNGQNMPKRWVACYESAESGCTKRGPRRATQLEAAQDKCDYLNGKERKARNRYKHPTVDLGTKTAHAPVVSSKRMHKPSFDGAYDLYDVLMYDPYTGEVLRRKVGITSRGQKRWMDTAITWGVSFKPVAPAVTYASKIEAEAAETQRIIEVCDDPNWRRVAGEAFAPAKVRTDGSKQEGQGVLVPQEAT